MNDQIAQQLLAKVLDWQHTTQPEVVDKVTQDLQLLASYKFDAYQRFGPGERFIESLANWLGQFEPKHRTTALDFVLNRLVFISEAEFFHLVQTAYPDVILPERMKLVAEEQDIPLHKVSQIRRHRRFVELGVKSLYLGLSDGSRTSEIRRVSPGEISNEQIWQAYELGAKKGAELLRKLRKSLVAKALPSEEQKFTIVWLLDDFSGSGNTYIRLENGEYEGKIRKALESLRDNKLVDPAHYEVFLLLYVATRQAIDHIEYWAERFTSEHGFKSIQLRVIQILEADVPISIERDAIAQLVEFPDYYDPEAQTDHTEVGGTKTVRWGFANCGLPVVLSHNTPNNSIYLLWGEDSFKFKGLFPRVSRHR